MEGGWWWWRWWWCWWWGGVDTKLGSVGNLSEGVPQLLKEGPNPTVYHIDVN